MVLLVEAGIASQFGFTPTDLTFDLPSAQTVATNVAANALAKTAIMGGSLTDNLLESAVGTGISIGGAIGANKIGDVTAFENGKLTQVAMHAALGGLMAEAMGGDFRTGALAAGANAALVDFLAEKLLPAGGSSDGEDYKQGVNKLLAASQLIGVLAAAATGGDASVAAAVSANGTLYNYLNHADMEKLAEKLNTCEQTNTCDGVSTKYFEKHLADEKTLKAVCAVDKTGCQAGVLDIYNAVLGFQRGDYDVENLSPELKRTFESFQELNLDASAAPTAAIAMPSIEAFIQALGLDTSDPRVSGVTVALATLVVGKALSGAKGILSASRSTEVSELFSSSNPRSGIQIGNRSLLEEPNTGNAKIFAGATDVEVKQYFSELTGAAALPSPRSIPGKGDIYVVSTEEGNFTLRNFSSSSGQTGPAWTIDIPKAAAGTTYNPEIKFLIGGP